MFLFFSNRLGCGGSILLSVTITVVLLLLWPGSSTVSTTTCIDVPGLR